MVRSSGHHKDVDMRAQNFSNYLLMENEVSFSCM